jgi:lipopolysaccharide/colanic/teichoic acid biosynthesis glycosyltransferase
MSLVGPRPKVPHHQTHVLQVRPGITGAASLAFRNEETVLHGVPDEHLDLYQVRLLMPIKKNLDDDYAERATLLTDVGLLCKTVLNRGAQLEEEGMQRFRSSLASLNLALHAHHRFATPEMQDSQEVNLAHTA